jgi:FkbM family methyltransferase
MPPARAIKMWILDKSINMFYPNVSLAYSNFGSDDKISEFFLENYLGKKITGKVNKLDSGFYVDVGCYDPISHSNTFSLYKKGWRGINIDANRKAIEKFQEMRHQDTNVHAAIADVRERKTFYEFESASVSSFDEEHVAKWKERDHVVDKYELETVPLTDVLDEHEAPRDFDLLDVDVEGFDLRVLKSLDFTRYRPKLILVEIHDTNAVRVTEHPIYAYLADKGYVLEAYALQTGFFIDESAKTV